MNNVYIFLLSVKEQHNVIIKYKRPHIAEFIQLEDFRVTQLNKSDK